MASILLLLPGGVPLFDPGPESTWKRDVELADTWDESVIGVVGWSTGGLDALRTAEAHPELPRLIIAATPLSDEHLLDVDLGAVAAKTLLLFGNADPRTGSSQGRAWQRRLPNARLEMVPGAGHELLQPMWSRILSHLAPRRRR